jgi:hypothetical protein
MHAEVIPVDGLVRVSQQGLRVVPGAVGPVAEYSPFFRLLKPNHYSR